MNRFDMCAPRSGFPLLPSRSGHATMAPAASKRALSHSQSSQSPSQGSQTRPSKRPRVRGPSTSLPATATSATTTKTDAAPPAAAVRSSQSPPKAGASEEPGRTTTTPAPTRSQLPPPRKRTVHPGSLRRLSTGHPARTLKGASDPPDRTREKATLSGAKVGGKSKDLKDRVQAEELWIRRPNRKGARATTHGKQGLGYAGYLKMGVAAFVQRGSVRMCSAFAVSLGFVSRIGTRTGSLFGRT